MDLKQQQAALLAEPAAAQSAVSQKLNGDQQAAFLVEPAGAQPAESQKLFAKLDCTTRREERRREARETSGRSTRGAVRSPLGRSSCGAE